MALLTGKRSLIAGILAAIGASACCVGPLVLLTLGIGGTFVGALTEMEPYRPFFIFLTLLFLGLTFRELYSAPLGCASHMPCTDPHTRGRQRATFWVIATLLITLLSAPWLAPFFF